MKIGIVDKLKQRLRKQKSSPQIDFSALRPTQSSSSLADDGGSLSGLRLGGSPSLKVKRTSNQSKPPTRVRTMSMDEKRGRKESGDRFAAMAMLSDTLWMKILHLLDIQSLGRASQACLRLNRLCMIVWSGIPRPNYRQAQLDVKEMIKMMANFRGPDKKSLENKEDWSTHPFWKKKMSRFRMISLSSPERRKPTDLVEFRLLHGRYRYHAILLGPKGRQHFRSEHMRKADCLLLMDRFALAMHGDFVCTFKIFRSSIEMDKAVDDEYSCVENGDTMETDLRASIEFQRYQ